MTDPSFDLILTARASDWVARLSGLHPSGPQRRQRCRQALLLNLRRRDGKMIINGKVGQEGYASPVLGIPMTAIAWLANKLGEFGITFDAGQTILNSSFVRAMQVEAGDEVVARFDSGLGDVLTSFD